MDNNERVFIEKLMNSDEDISNAQTHIKENFNIESKYDKENNRLYIWSNNINENLNLALSRDFIESKVGDFVDIVYGKI
jgi:hypothetical protein